MGAGASSTQWGHLLIFLNGSNLAVFYHLVLACWSSLNHYLFVASEALDETFETSKGKCDALT